MPVTADTDESTGFQLRQWARPLTDAAKLDTGLATLAAQILEGAMRLDAKALALRQGGTPAPVAG